MKKSLRQTIVSNKWLILIFLLAAAVRLYHLDSLPKSFYVEELTNTYVGKFIFLHGRDISGHPWPLLYFDKFGDYPPVLPLYLSGASALLFGTNEFAGRLPVALAGALFVFAIYQLANLLFKSEKTGLFVAFIAAILPWHVVLSRTTAEGVVGLTAWAFGLVWVVRGISEKKNSLIWKSFALFGLSYFLYPALRILVPLTLLPLPYLTFRTDKKRTKILIAAFLFFTLLTGGISMTKWGRARFDQTSLLKSPQTAQSVALRNQILSAGLGSGHVLRARIFHNKITGYTREFLNQYLSYFSTKFLFLEGGGGQYRYYNVPDQGLLYISLLPFFLFAIIGFAGAKKSFMAYVVYLLAVAPIPSALTVDFTPHAHRSMFMILPLVLIAGSGFYILIQGGIIKKLVLWGSMGFLLLEFIYFWNQYAWQSNAFQSVLRNDGDKEIALYMKNERKKYDRIYAPIYERLPFYYLFYTQNFDKSLIGRFHDELQLDSVDNVSFMKSWCPTRLAEVQQTAPQSSLIIERGDCDIPQKYQVVQTIVRMDGTRAYNILKPL